MEEYLFILNLFFCFSKLKILPPLLSEDQGGVFRFLLPLRK